MNPFKSINFQSLKDRCIIFDVKAAKILVLALRRCEFLDFETETLQNRDVSNWMEPDSRFRD